MSLVVGQAGLHAPDRSGAESAVATELRPGVAIPLPQVVAIRSAVVTAEHEHLLAPWVIRHAVPGARRRPTGAARALRLPGIRAVPLPGVADDAERVHREIAA